MNYGSVAVTLWTCEAYGLVTRRIYYVSFTKYPTPVSVCPVIEQEDLHLVRERDIDK